MEAMLIIGLLPTMLVIALRGLKPHEIQREKKKRITKWIERIKIVHQKRDIPNCHCAVIKQEISRSLYPLIAMSPTWIHSHTYFLNDVSADFLFSSFVSRLQFVFLSIFPFICWYLFKIEDFLLWATKLL